MTSNPMRSKCIEKSAFIDKKNDVTIKSTRITVLLSLHDL